MNANDIKSDTLTLLLCNQAHKFLPVKQRAVKIAKCCKGIARTYLVELKSLI